MAKVVGIGGVFFRSPDPVALRAWYARVLGLEITAWGAVKFPPLTNGVTVWTPFEASTTHFDPSQREMMVNFVVDDLDGVIAQAEREGATILKREDADTYGRFAWLMDPDGTKLELWQPSAQ
jgi:predicted enzyme related to lactoylglutathione lyase